jgi:hypothetical protein
MTLKEKKRKEKKRKEKKRKEKKRHWNSKQNIALSVELAVKNDTLFSHNRLRNQKKYEVLLSTEFLKLRP